MSKKWYQKLNPLYRKKSIAEEPINEEELQKLRKLIEDQVKGIHLFKERYNALQLTEQNIEENVLRTLKGQLFGQVMILTDQLQKKLTRKQELESLLEVESDLNKMTKNLIIEYKATIDAITSELQFWDAQPIIEQSKKYLIEIKKNDLRYFKYIFNNLTLIRKRIENLKKIEPTLDCKWPKNAEKEAIFQYIEVLRCQICYLQDKFKSTETENKKMKNELNEIKQKYYKLEKNDKFTKSKQKFLRKTLSLTCTNLGILDFINRGLTFANLTEHIHITKLLDELTLLKNHQIELNDKIHELKHYETEIIEIKDQQIFLQDKLTHKTKLLTQIAIENIALRRKGKLKDIIFEDFPERENIIIQQLVQNEIELTNRNVELEEKIKESTKQATIHEVHSRHVAQTLKSLIGYLEKVTDNFLISEEEERNQIIELKEILDKEQMESLMSCMNQEDIDRLNEEVINGHVEQLLTKLNENVKQKNQFYELIKKLNEGELSQLIANLSSDELKLLAEAVASKKFDEITNILNTAISKVEDLEDENTERSERVEELVKLMQEMQGRLRRPSPSEFNSEGSN